MMGGWLPLLLLFVYGGLCLSAVLCNQRLLRLFLTKRPDLVARHLPEAFGRWRHPRKLFFFLKPSTAKVLADDQELLQLRTRLIRIIWCIPLYLIITAGLMILAMALKL